MAIKNIFPGHLEDLRRSGLSDVTIRLNEAKALVGWVFEVVATILEAGKGGVIFW